MEYHKDVNDVLGTKQTMHKEEIGQVMLQDGAIGSDYMDINSMDISQAGDRDRTRLQVKSAVDCNKSCESKQ